MNYSTIEIKEKTLPCGCKEIDSYWEFEKADGKKVVSPEISETSEQFIKQLQDAFNKKHKEPIKWFETMLSLERQPELSKALLDGLNKIYNEDFTGWRLHLGHRLITGKCKIHKFKD